MVEPTRAFDSLLEEVARPLHRELASIVRLLLGASANDEDVRFCALSIMGQCVYYHHARTVIARLYPEQKYGAEDIARLVDHISEFSLAALRDSREESRRKAMKLLKLESLIKPRALSRGVHHRRARRRRLRRRYACYRSSQKREAVPSGPGGRRGADRSGARRQRQRHAGGRRPNYFGHESHRETGRDHCRSRQPREEGPSHRAYRSKRLSPARRTSGSRAAASAGQAGTTAVREQRPGGYRANRDWSAKRRPC